MNVGGAITENGRDAKRLEYQCARKSKSCVGTIYRSIKWLLFKSTHMNLFPRYAPFEFKKVVNKNGKVRIEVKRMYGCACHSHIRENVIRKAKERKGWEPFGQWSMKKAQSLANRLADRINRSNGDSNSSSSDSDEEGNDSNLDDLKLCHNGLCVWRYKHKYDDIMEEIETFH